MPHHVDPRVDAYIEDLPDRQQAICREVREIVHAADAAVEETIKRTRLPYFTLDGNICALMGTKHHVNVFIYDPIAPDPAGLINQGHENLTARSIQVRKGEPIKRAALLDLFKEVISNDRRGGWRRIVKARG